ncbi:MAG: xanthine dehydrogenase accessory protein XdhC [Bdellovibrionota bacterium]
MMAHWMAAAELEEAGEVFVVVTIVSGKGHIPQDIGAKCIVTQKGLHAGTVGGGKIEARCILHAKEILQAENRDPQLITWNLTRDIGMTCGGEATILFEITDPKKWSIAIFGAGHVSQALNRTLLNLDCSITCIDNRSEWLAKLPESPKLKKVLSENAREVVSKLSGQTFFVVMTQGHGSDVPILEEIFKTFPDAPYIGVMGSDVKADRIRRDLLALGIDAGLIEKLRSPIGLDLGGNQPFEIAISVTAQLLQCRDTAKENQKS